MPDPTTDFHHLRSRLEIDDEDARLKLNGQEMILLPRHFFRYILRDVKNALGAEAFRQVFLKAGHDGALTFCRRFREVHQCTPEQAVKGYLAEMSLRGWGRFSIVALELEREYIEVLLQNSALAAEGDLPSGHVIWEGSMLGVLSFLREDDRRSSGKLPGAQSKELPAARGGHSECRIIVGPQE